MVKPPTKLYPVRNGESMALPRARLVPIHTGLNEKILEWAADADNAEYFRRYAPLFAMQFNFGDPHCWAVYLGEQPIGLAALTDIEPGSRKAAMGLLLEKPFRTNDNISTTCREVGKYVFEYLGYNKMYTLTLAHRTALHSRLELAGFSREALLTENCFWKGKYWDEVMHSINKSKYDQLYLENT